jgi:hypothetical protein
MRKIKRLNVDTSSIMFSCIFILRTFKGSPRDSLIASIAKQASQVLEHLPNGTPCPAGDFMEALNGKRGLAPVAPALELVGELRSFTGGSLFWDLQGRHITAVVKARNVSAEASRARARLRV